MARQILFSDSISINKIRDPKLDTWVETTLDKHKKQSDSASISNVGGYQTKDVLDEESIKLFGQYAALAMRDFTNKKFKYAMHNMWINENYKYSYNKYHNHSDCHFAGVYYHKVPKDSGSLEFHRTDATAFLNLSTHFQTSDTHTGYRIDPYAGMLVVFPSSYGHSVHQSMSDEPRVSVAFNFSIIGVNK